MAPCAIALQEMLHICHNYSISVDVNFNALKSFCCHNYSISVDVNFNALKSFCIAFTQKPFQVIVTTSDY